MSYVYTLNLSAVPAPIARTIQITNGAGGSPFSSGMSALLANILNQVSYAAAAGAATSSTVCGIVSGLTLSSPSGLQIACSNGLCLMDGFIEITGTSPTAPYQFITPANLTLPDNSTSYVWLTTSGLLASATTTTPPTGAKVYLGQVTTLSGAVTKIDGSGVVTINPVPFMQTADAWQPNANGTQGVAVLTSGSLFLWDQGTWRVWSASGAQNAYSAQFQTSASNITLAASSANVQVVTMSAGSLSVNLPAAAGITMGHWFQIYNGGSNSFTVKLGATTVCTIATGQVAMIAATLKTGAADWPASVTPTTIPAGA